MNFPSPPVVCACLLMLTALAIGGDDDFQRRKSDAQKVIDSQSFQFDEDHASAQYSLTQCDAKWDAHMTAPAGAASASFTFRCTNGKLLSIDGHSTSVFRIAGDTLFFAHFSPAQTGCAVAEYDLREGKEIWRTKLQGIGRVDHEQYRNRVTLDLPNDGSEVVRIAGHESAGDYIEILDCKSGVEMAHRKFR